MTRKATISVPDEPTRRDVCYAPLVAIGLGTGNAAVIDQRSGRKVTFKIDRVTLVGDLACVACRILDANSGDGMFLVRLPDGTPAWVFDVRDVFDTNTSLPQHDDTAA